MDNGWIVGLLGSAFGAGGVITVLVTRPKIKAEAEHTAVGSLSNVIDHLNAEIERLQIELNVQRDYRIRLERRVEKLEGFIRDHTDLQIPIHKEDETL
jgi:TolA-binding protein